MEVIPSEHLSFLIPCLWNHVKKQHRYTPLLPSKLDMVGPVHPDSLVHQLRQHQDAGSNINREMGV